MESKRQQPDRVVFSSYYLVDFDFQTAKKAIASNIEIQIPDKKALKKTFSEIVQKPPWPFVLPYMYGHITNNSTQFNGPGYYNYVLGYTKEQPEQLVLRLGYYDEQAIEAALARARQEKSKSSQQTVIGIKHMQLGSIDLNIMFAGVLIFKEDNTVMVSPMSGTWFEIMKKYKSDHPEVENLMTALNVMNIICTSYALTIIPEQPDITVASCCKYKCKYTKASCKQPQDKICQAVPKFMSNKLTLDLTCMHAYLKNTAEPIQCFNDIPVIKKT